MYGDDLVPVSGGAFFQHLLKASRPSLMFSALGGAFLGLFFVDTLAGAIIWACLVLIFTVLTAVVIPWFAQHKNAVQCRECGVIRMRQNVEFLYQTPKCRGCYHPISRNE